MIAIDQIDKKELKDVCMEINAILAEGGEKCADIGKIKIVGVTKEEQVKQFGEIAEVLGDREISVSAKVAEFHAKIFADEIEGGAKETEETEEAEEANTEKEAAAGAEAKKAPTTRKPKKAKKAGEKPKK